MIKSRIKFRLALVVTMIIALVFPLQVFAEKSLNPVITLNFTDVESLMMARNQMILDNSEAYYNANNNQSGVQNATYDIHGLLVQLANINSADPDIMALRNTLAGLLQAQAQMATATNSMVQGTNISAVGAQTEQGNYTIVWNMEMLYISYNNLTQQIEDMKAKFPLLEKQLSVAKLQKQLGLTTDAGVTSAATSLNELKSGLKQLEEAQKSIKQTFNVNLAQPYDTDIQIGKVPMVTQEQISVINVDADYTEALKKAYGVRVEEYKRDTDKKNDEIRKFQNSFYRTYITVTEKQKALEVEQGKMDVAKSNKNAADIKYKLGMISSIQYAGEVSSYSTRKAMLAQAENNLFQAYHQYQWAKRGLIVSGGSANPSGGM